MTCAACGCAVSHDERHELVCWLDPDSIACIAHERCLDVYEEILALFELGEV